MGRLVQRSLLRSPPEWPVKVKWVDGLQFVASDREGHSVVMDTRSGAGGEGSAFTPMKLVLAAVAGCTAMDIVVLLRKRRQVLEGLQVWVKAEQNPLYPHYFTKVHLRYVLRGHDLQDEAVKEAIRLSDEKYCSVGANLKGKTEITTSFEVRREQ